MSVEHVRGGPIKILVLNPNSSKTMTDGMKAIINAADLPESTEVYAYTAPADAPASINNGEDIEQSTRAVTTDIEGSDFWSRGYSGVLVACYSVHPLVPFLEEKMATTTEGTGAAVTGIFEASITAAMMQLSTNSSWGIVTTGKFWEAHLARGVLDFLGIGGDSEATTSTRFAGVESTGLNASDFHHGVDPEVVRRKLKEATLRLLRKADKVTCIVMGCAGMAGLEDIIRSAAAEEYGHSWAYRTLCVIDGVREGIRQLDMIIRDQRLQSETP
ncbi:Asp/Glu/hydantoin racemase [Hypoxylon sp. FL1284]|nr:Asp/Glu/hydantoin racemase [Hypoxylon sp. FL1284]